MREAIKPALGRFASQQGRAHYNQSPWHTRSGDGRWRLEWGKAFEAPTAANAAQASTDGERNLSTIRD